MKLLSNIGTNFKLAKSDKASDYYSTILHLAPHTVSGNNVCSSASKGCAAACLNTSGFGRYSNVQNARIRKTKLFFEQREVFKKLILKDIEAFLKKCDKNGKKPAIRLNGTSDIVWEKVWPELFVEYPQVQFYDYTKHMKRCLSNWSLPPNYYISFSRSEENDWAVDKVMEAGKVNVVVVFKGKLPLLHRGLPVFNGDETDLRFLDPPQHIIGLLPKGKGRFDKSGFVVDWEYS